MLNAINAETETRIKNDIVKAATDMLNRGAPDVEDDQGFNKVYFGVVFKIIQANIKNKKPIKRNQYVSLIKALIRHKGQVAGMGYDIDEMASYKTYIESNPISVDYDPDEKVLILEMAYNEAHIKKLKNIKDVKYCGDGINKIAVTSAMELAREFDAEHNGDVKGFISIVSNAIRPHGLTSKIITERWPNEVKTAKEYRKAARERLEKADSDVKVFISFDGAIEMIKVATDGYIAAIAAAIKAMPYEARKWDNNTKAWNVKPEYHEMMRADIRKVYAGDVDDTAADKLAGYVQKKAVNLDDVRAGIDTTEATRIVLDRYSVIDGKSLYPHQPEGIAYMLTVGNCINADDVGLGKTIQGILSANIQREKLDSSPVLVIVPVVLKTNWVRELTMWLGKDSGNIVILKSQEIFVYAYDASQKSRFKRIGKTKMPKNATPEEYAAILVDIKADWVITNYDIAEKLRPQINVWKKEAHCQIIMLDEAHYIKNDDATRTKAIIGWNKSIMVDKDGNEIKRGAKDDKGRKIIGTKKYIKQEGICQGMTLRYALTGTPNTGRNKDMYNLLKFIDHELAKNKKAFLNRYCDPQENRFASSGWDYNGATNSDELFTLCATNMIQRQKPDVIAGFPEKTRQYHYVDIDTDEYWAYWDEYVSTYEKRTGKPFNEDAAQLTELSVLRHQASKQKIPIIKEFAKEIVDAGRKIVIFTGYTETANALSELFGDAAVKIVGGMTEKAKDDVVQAFQSDSKIRVCVCNYLAAGVGLTLTAADEMIMADLVWRPDQHFQAEGRIWRIGQKNNVIIHYFIANETHEISVQKAVEEKAIVIDQMEKKNYEVAMDWKETFKAFLSDIKELRADHKKKKAA